MIDVKDIEIGQPAITSAACTEARDPAGQVITGHYECFQTGQPNQRREATGQMIVAGVEGAQIRQSVERRDRAREGVIGNNVDLQWGYVSDGRYDAVELIGVEVDSVQIHQKRGIQRITR